MTRYITLVGACFILMPVSACGADEIIKLECNVKADGRALMMDINSTQNTLRFEGPKANGEKEIKMFDGIKIDNDVIIAALSPTETLKIQRSDGVFFIIMPETGGMTSEINKIPQGVCKKAAPKKAPERAF